MSVSIGPGWLIGPGVAIGGEGGSGVVILSVRLLVILEQLQVAQLLQLAVQILLLNLLVLVVTQRKQLIILVNNRILGILFFWLNITINWKNHGIN